MSDAFDSTAAQLGAEIDAIVGGSGPTGDGSTLMPLRSALAIQSHAAELVAAAVDRARTSGRTWQDIAGVLGVTRQAAFQRFGKPIDPRTGETMSTTPLPEATPLAESVIDALAVGRWGEVTSRFDAQMNSGLTRDGLAAAWAQIVGMAGAYESRGTPEATRAADITITSTPLAFEAGDFTARISFRDDQSIAGLYILPAETQP